MPGRSTTCRTCSSRWATCWTSQAPPSGSGTASSATTTPSTSARASARWPMRDLTNLSWPEAPFGAAQRPFGQDARLVAAVTFVCEAWGDRMVKGRGLAQMFDTQLDRTDVAVCLDPPLDQDNAPTDGLGLVERSLAIGLAAACRLGLLAWGGSFRVREAVAEAAWDLVDQADQA